MMVGTSSGLMQGETKSAPPHKTKKPPLFHFQYIINSYYDEFVPIVNTDR
jgi:hypothetical protein